MAPEQSFCAFKCIMPETDQSCRTQRRVWTFKDSLMLIKINELSKKSSPSSRAVINSLFHLPIDSSPELCILARTRPESFSLSSSSPTHHLGARHLLRKESSSPVAPPSFPCFSTRLLAYIFLTPMLLFARCCSSRSELFRYDMRCTYCCYCRSATPLPKEENLLFIFFYLVIIYKYF